MKKMLSAILSLAMVFTMCTTAFAAEEQAADGTFDGYQEIVQSSFSQRSATPATLSNSNDKVIIHNNGNLMISDYFAEGKNDGNSLVAVTYIPVDGKIIETAHFTVTLHAPVCGIGKPQVAVSLILCHEKITPLQYGLAP